ncbi:MAG: hypothetical protein ABFD82_06935 [Syntrophaceae bacterium]
MENILFFDIETEVNPEAVDLIQVPSAPSNYKDPDKIAAYLAEKKEESLKNAALDADYGRIVAISMQVGLYGQVITNDINSDHEWRLLDNFWNAYNDSHGFSCGYNIIGFDLPYLMRRSFDLGIYVPIIPTLAKYRTEPTIDLMGILYNWGQAKSLKWVCKRYGIDNPLPDLDGSQVKDMDAETLRAYSANDVQLVVELYEKMQGIYF